MAYPRSAGAQFAYLTDTGYLHALRFTDCLYIYFYEAAICHSYCIRTMTAVANRFAKHSRLGFALFYKGFTRVLGLCKRFCVCFRVSKGYCGRVIDSSTNSCGSSVESLFLCCRRVYRWIESRCQLAKYWQRFCKQMDRRRRGSRGVEFHAVWFYLSTP